MTLFVFKLKIYTATSKINYSKIMLWGNIWKILPTKCMTRRILNLNYNSHLLNTHKMIILWKNVVWQNDWRPDGRTGGETHIFQPHEQTQTKRLRLEAACVNTSRMKTAVTFDWCSGTFCNNSFQQLKMWSVVWWWMSATIAIQLYLFPVPISIFPFHFSICIWNLL